MEYKHIVTTHDFCERTLLTLCREAERWGGSLDGYGDPPQPLKGKVVATLFHEPSTRTRLSFEAAVQRLGGDVITVADKTTSSDKKGESYWDAIRTISEYADLIVSRTGFPLGDAFDDDVRLSELPCHFINAGDGSNTHPTQALLDYYTIRKYKQVMEPYKICIVGDLANSRTINSFVEIMGRYPGNTLFLYNSVMNEVELPRDREPLAPVHHLDNMEQFNHYLPEFDILYLNRVQKERHDPENFPGAIPENFELTEEHLSRMKMESLILNPGPRQKEQPQSLDKDGRVKFFEQARNGMLTRMALLDYMFTPDGLL